MDIAFSTDSGGLPLNEDACQAWGDSGLFAVCDGLSVGKGGGEVASRLALEALGRWAADNREAIAKARSMNSRMVRENVQSRLASAFQEASRVVFQNALSDPKLQNTCTTMDAILLLGGYALLAHVGSGRVYLARRGELHQLTEDHTQLAQLRRTGKLAEVPEAQRAACAKRLLRAVGFREEVQVDLFAVELEAGDRFVLVTDGVWAGVPETELEKLLLAPGPAAGVLKAVNERISAAKARDNFTTLVLEPQAGPSPAAEESAEAKIKMLGTVPAFAHLSYQELIRVINTGELAKLGAGAEIWKEGAAGEEMMLLLSGSVEISRNGKRLNTLKKGDVIGEMSMIDSAPRSATVRTLEPTNLLAFPREALFALLREEQELAVKFLWGVTMEMNKRMRSMSQQLAGGTAIPPAIAQKRAPLPFHRGEA